MSKELKKSITVSHGEYQQREIKQNQIFYCGSILGYQLIEKRTTKLKDKGSMIVNLETRIKENRGNLYKKDWWKL